MRKITAYPLSRIEINSYFTRFIGGNTKTTLIATISPAQVNLLETCSTLDYASKAKTSRMPHDWP